MYSLCSMSRSRSSCLSADAVSARPVRAVEVVEHGHVERGGGGPFLFISADVKIVVIRPPVGQPVDQPRVAMEREDDGFVFGEDGIEQLVGKSVRMLAG